MKRFLIFGLLTASILMLASCRPTESMQDDPLAPGSVSGVTLSAAFVLDQTPFYLTSESELYAFEDSVSQIVDTFPTSQVFQCPEKDCLVFLSDGALTRWTPDGGCTALAVNGSSLNDFSLLGGTENSALCTNQSSLLCVDLSDGTVQKLDAAGDRVLACCGETAYLYEPGASVTAVDCASGSVLYSLDWSVESDIIAACVHQDSIYFVLFNGSVFRSDLQLSAPERVNLPTRYHETNYTKIAIASDGERLILIGHSQNTKIAVFQVDLETLTCTCVDIRDGHYAVPSTCKAVLRDGVYGYAVTSEPVSSLVFGTLG